MGTNIKGKHEKAMELARDLLNQNVGMTEIISRTGLTQDDVQKEQRKMRNQKK
ncbi:hypothetical protein [Clostridium cellulovorans]|uniref:Transposase n=1 Tax=Clostridium cellulovorans (strain ATCC 35296 / DSM 3052 / OCM 3 / 743B) TaxID=573061 RepID=D9SL52_CLOC7|nr:hypothetical protein [Clostridium cellulovorans]ADL51568.1 hypothetical protein Clocel_1824 [Clostridium cellulovorans 743B]